jgi:hypothetical protein
MSFLTNITKPHIKEIWKHLSEEIGGSFIDGGFWGKDSVILNYRSTAIVLENSTFSHNKRHSTTTIKCPFCSTNNFKFNISTEDALTHAGKVFGIHDIQTGNKKFDNEMYLKSSDKNKLLNFLDNETITKQYLDLARNISYGPIIKITEDNPTFSLTRNPQNTLWLYIESVGLEGYKETIKMYFDTFKLTLDRLIEIGEAEDISPDIS